MPASSSETRAKWRKRKRDQAAARKAKLKEQENDDVFEDNEEDDDPDLDPPQNHMEADDDHMEQMNHNAGRRESEKLFDGGVRISEFPIAIKREVSRPHSSVFRIVEAERSTLNGDSRGHGQGVPMLENLSYGQLQALSAVPRDSPALLGAQGEESASGSGSYVIAPPRITAGSGIIKRLGSAGRILVLPVHSEWFSLNSVHRLERQVVPHFFTGKSADHTPEKYMEARNFILARYMENPEKQLTVSDCHGVVAGVNNDDLTRIVRFLDQWGIINYCATSLKYEFRRDETYLCEDPNNSELRVPSAALKSIDSLIKFDSPKSRLKASDVYPELSCQHRDESDFDSSIREQLTEHRCNCCFRSIPTVYYQSQKEVDVRLCLECFHEGGFVPGHSSLDFVKENSMKDYGYVDGDSWSDQETLLLLEGVQLYNDNWNKIAEHVGSKSKAQCILHFVRLPLEAVPIDNIDVPSTSGSSSKDNHEKTDSNSNGFSKADDTDSELPFADSGNPVMHMVAFLASALGPRVAAACAHAALASLSKDGEGNGEPNSNKIGSWNPQEAEGVAVSAAKVRAAAKDGLNAAAMKAKLFADHEEREIQRLSANIINHQLKRLELKLKQFAEIETLLMRECEQMERTRQRIAAERNLMATTQFGFGVQRPKGLPGVASAGANNAPSRPQQAPAPQQPFMGGFGNNQQVHPHMSLMQQPGMYGLSPRMPLPNRPSPSTSNANANPMFNPGSNAQPLSGHPMHRPASGGKSNLG